MAKVYRIAVVIDTDGTYGRQIFRGILNCPRHPYHLVFAPWPVDFHFLPHLRDWRPDGIIAHQDHPELAKGIHSLGVPTVRVVGSTYPELMRDLLWVGIDDYAVGAMAANYLMEQGFRNFGFSHYVGMSHSGPIVFPFSADRYAGFSRVLEAAGFSCHSVDEQPHSHAPWPKPYQADNPDERWLRALPKPVAILAANDLVGSRLLDICTHANLRVPEDVAVLGVDDDDLVCLTNQVPLSSIEPPNEKIGLQAMSLMKRLLAGETIPNKPTLFPPLRVVERLSSNKLAVADENVAAAIRFIRDHVSEPIGVDEVAAAIMISRRQLEIKFRAAMRQSPAQQIRQERFDQARRRLVETNDSVTQIALAVGLHRAGELSILFREKCQMTPTAYRDKYRPAAIKQEFSPQRHRGAEKREDEK